MINDEIRDKEIRLIGSDGAQLGIVDTREAQRMADEKQLDLVKIAPAAKPPVCKIMDYSKFKFEQAKKEKEARRKQKIIEMKEIRLSPNIDTHYVNVRIKQALEFLKSGDKVKVSIRFRYGREMGRAAAAQTIMLDFAKALDEYSTIDRPPKMEARNMIMFLNPRPQQAKPAVPQQEAN
jgi:translation initiation factor IF-3